MKSQQVTIIDYGVGNLLSVKRGFEKCGANVKISSNPKEILSASKIVLPGVGAFPNAMLSLDKLKLISVIMELVDLKKPILAICLGMQLLMEQSDEFKITQGLGIIPGKVTKIPIAVTSEHEYKIPHIGWSQLVQSPGISSWDKTVLKGVAENESVYFVHSYMVEPEDKNARIADVNYGDTRISAVIAQEQITGCQFHPEKSGKLGLKILNNFISI